MLCKDCSLWMPEGPVVPSCSMHYTGGIGINHSKMALAGLEQGQNEVKTKLNSIQCQWGISWQRPCVKSVHWGGGHKEGRAGSTGSRGRSDNRILDLTTAYAWAESDWPLDGELTQSPRDADRSFSFLDGRLMTIDQQTVLCMWPECKSNTTRISLFRKQSLWPMFWSCLYKSHVSSPHYLPMLTFRMRSKVY